MEVARGQLAGLLEHRTDSAPRRYRAHPDLPTCTVSGDADCRSSWTGDRQRPDRPRRSRPAPRRCSPGGRRDQAEHLALAAGELALDARAEDLAHPVQQTGWRTGPIAGYITAALPLIARAVLAAAVAADRAAGATWDEIAVVLDISADPAARRDRPN